MTDNVLEGPWKARLPRSAKEIELERVEREFRKMGRGDDDIFLHLAQKMAAYLEEAQPRGSKAGAIGRIIGGDTDKTARHRNRFSWDGAERDFKQQPLAKNPGQWLAVIRRCAEELKRPIDDLLLEAFAGSRLRPSLVPTDYAQASWLRSFLDLMMALDDRLCGQPQVEDLLDYITAAHLEFDYDGELAETEEPILPWFRADVPDWKEMLFQLPHTRVCSSISGAYFFAPDEGMAESERQAWHQIIEGCQAAHLIETHRISLAMKVRRGLAIIPGEGFGRPRLALFKWPAVVLEASDLEVIIDQNSQKFELPLYAHPIAGEILYPDYPDYAPHLVHRVLFAPVGTEEFTAIASEFFREYHGSIGGADESCWDPLFADEVVTIEWASSAPKTTVAAMIERNLLFADLAGFPELRIDRLLQSDLDSKIEAVHRHRTEVERITGPARNNLFAEWTGNAARAQKDESSSTGDASGPGRS